eukprot:8677185-Ditylum_brightwellii.AAC.1
MLSIPLAGFIAQNIISAAYKEDKLADDVSDENSPDDILIQSDKVVNFADMMSFCNNNSDAFSRDNDAKEHLFK